jgi:hypothetical protein
MKRLCRLWPVIPLTWLAWRLWVSGPVAFASCSDGTRRAVDRGFDFLCALDERHDPSSMLPAFRIAGVLHIFGPPLLLLLAGWSLVWMINRARAE